jgi:hypothetical protein
MSAYSVGRAPDGSWVWWENWKEPHQFPETRAATDEEALIMDRIVWHRASALDLERLKEMLQSPHLSTATYATRQERQ